MEDRGAGANIDRRASVDAVASECGRRHEQEGRDRREEQPAHTDALVVVIVIVGSGLPALA